MLQAYVDASGKGDPRFLVIAGYIATAETWEGFSREWKSRLDQAQMPYFKMNQMSGRLEIAGWFYRVIEEFDIKASIACIINTAELLDVEKSIIYPSYITNPNSADNPYYWGFKNIIGILAERQHQFNLIKPVDFIFDTDSEQTKIPRAWDLLKKAAPHHMSSMIGDMPIFRDDVRTMPLQAADLYAWWAFKWQREGIADWATHLPFPWPIKRNIPRLAAYFGKRSFLFDISKTLENLARTSDELKYAQSLMPEEWREAPIIPSGKI